VVLTAWAPRSRKPRPSLDPSAPQPDPPAVIRALVKGETSAGTCLLRLVPNGVVQGAASCGWSPVLTRVKRWRRTEDCICLLAGARELLLAFQASGGGAFRAQGVEPETLEMRLLPATSMPMSR
jgi:hypothetical protein